MIRCLLIDDEPHALDLMEYYIDQAADMHVLGKCRNITESLKVLQKEQPDLIFLDIQMPGIDGISFLSAFPHSSNIIITTAHRKYAIDGFEFGVLDYLLKPFSYQRFTKAVQRYRNTIATPAILQEQKKENTEHIVLRSGYERYKVDPGEILYLEGSREYVKLHLPCKKLLVRSSMRGILEKLPNGFIQVHKSYIVPVAKITVITAHYIHIGSVKIPIGRSYKQFVGQLLEKSKVSK